MIIEYRGINIEEGRNYREANIWYDEDNNKELEKADKMYKILKEKGWGIVAEYGWMGVRVYDKEEYKEFLADYKEAKKKAK